MKEVWKPVVGYEGLYSVSNLGRARREAVDIFISSSKSGRSSSYTRSRSEKILVGCTNNQGRLYFDLYNGGKHTRKRFYSHRLVATAFIGKIPKGMVVDHIDRDHTNNRVDNLRITTQSVNMQNSGGWSKKENPKNVYYDKRRGLYNIGKMINGVNFQKSGFKDIESAQTFLAEAGLTA